MPQSPKIIKTQTEVFSKKNPWMLGTCRPNGKPAVTTNATRALGYNISGVTKCVKNFVTPEIWILDLKENANISTRYNF